MADNRRFGRGGVYTCTECDKKTRETGEGESALEMCRSCYLEGGHINSVLDGNMTVAEFEKMYEKPFPFPNLLEDESDES